MDKMVLVKKLRAETGAGIDMCRLAAEDSNGAYDKAIEILRAKGLEKAAKKVNNITQNGSIVVKQNDKKLVLLNFRAETDFAVNSEGFCDFASKEATNLLNSDYDDINQVVIDNINFQDRLSVYASVLGENVILNKYEVMHNNRDTSNIVYFHRKVRKGYDDIAGLVVILQVSSDSPKDLCHNLAVHIAACESLVLSKEDITEDLKQEYKNIDDLVLYNQDYFHDNSLTVKQFVDQNNIKILNFKVLSA